MHLGSVNVDFCYQRQLNKRLVYNSDSSIEATTVANRNIPTMNFSPCGVCLFQFCSQLTAASLPSWLLILGMHPVSLAT